MSDVIGILTFPGGTAAINLHNLVASPVPVVVEYGGGRFALTGWDEGVGCFLAVQMNAGETPEQARARLMATLEPDK